MALCQITLKLLILGVVMVCCFVQDSEGIKIRGRISIRISFARTGKPGSVCNILQTRSDWGAVGDISGQAQPPPPIYHSIAIYDTGAQTCLPGGQYCRDLTCTDDESCKGLMITMQDYDRQNGFGDIKPNFLVGQDGQIYEGRGWDVVGEFEDPLRTIGIAFIGDFSSQAPNQASIDAVQTFLGCGVSSNRLLPDATLNAKKDTPLYEIFKTWGDTN